MTTTPCFINQPACGRLPGTPICPKCGLDARVVYPSEGDLEDALRSGQERYAAAPHGVDDILQTWGLVTRPRLLGGWIDVDNEAMIVSEDLDWSANPSYSKVMAAARKRIERIKAAAEGGDGKAALLWGRVLLDGYDEWAAHPSQAHFLYREALATGHEEACSYIGALYDNGQAELPKDDKKAREWYERGAAAGDARAMAYLADFHAEGKGGLVQDESLALKLTLEAAALGSGFALANLALMVGEGKWGLTKDSALVDILGDLALARGFAFGGFISWTVDAERFHQGNAREQVEKASAGQLCAVTDQANPMVFMGNMLNEIFPGITSNQEGTEWEMRTVEADAETWALLLVVFKTWAKFGLPQAMFATAILLCFKKTPAEQAEAANWLKAAAEAEDPTSQYFYGRLMMGIDISRTPKLPWDRERLPEEFRYGSMTEGKRWLERAAAQENKSAMYDLGTWLAITGKPEDRSKAVQYLSGAAEAGFKDAYFWLTLIHSKGFREGWEADPEASRKYCQLGAEAGVPYCMERWGAICYGQSEYAEALRWFTAAADAELPQAFASMAGYHFNGHGEGADPDQALAWAKRGAEIDSSDAMRILGMIYRHGKGSTRPDRHLAVEWLTKAAEKDDSEARDMLAAMKQEVATEVQQTNTQKRGFWQRLFS